MKVTHLSALEFKDDCVPKDSLAYRLTKDLNLSKYMDWHKYTMNGYYHHIESINAANAKYGSEEPKRNLGATKDSSDSEISQLKGLYEVCQTSLEDSEKLLVMCKNHRRELNEEVKDAQSKQRELESKLHDKHD